MSNKIILSVFQQGSVTEIANFPLMPFHQHDSLEISYVTEGYILVEYYDENKQLRQEYIHKHQFAIIKPECNHRMIFPTLNETLGVEFSCIKENIYDNLRNSIYVNTLPHATDLLKSFKSVIIFTDTHNVEYQLRRFKKYADKNYTPNEYSGEIFNITLKRLLIEILQCNQVPSNVKTNFHLKKAITYINLNYYKDIKTTDIANFLNISETYLQKMFRANFKTSVNHLINKVRIEKADELILNTNFSLRKISKDVGYGSTQAFITNFKKIHDCTPSQYKADSIKRRHFFRKSVDD